MACLKPRSAREALMRKRGWMMMAAAALALAACAPAEAPSPDSFRKTLLVGPLNEPVDLDVIDDGSVFIVERNGRILLWREGQEAAEVAQFTNLHQDTDRDENAEFGLLAIAADP